jgi:C-terminal domain on Strawberry notch homologue/P-loop containing NTP hydrolase pore-1
VVFLHQQLVTAFANGFTGGDNFASITSARKLAQSVLNQKIEPGTPIAKVVDESVERGLILAARQLVQKSRDPMETWEQCLDLYERQPALNTRTSTSILQQAYSTPVPIAFLAATLAQIDGETTVYEPTAGNGALLLLANPQLAIVNELNSDRATALRAQGFTVTERDASNFLPDTEAVNRIITNPPFSSLKDAQGQTRMFQRGRLTTSQLDHAIALSALDLMKADGRAVLILGGKMGNEESRTERYNTQLTRGFYRWLYKDAGYKVTDHFSLDGSLYRKQGTTFPVDVIVIEGRGETALKLPGVQPPRIYENYEDLKEVLVYASRQSIQPQKNNGIALQGIYARSSVDTKGIEPGGGFTPTFTVDNSATSRAIEPNREQGRIPNTSDATSGVANRGNDRRLADELRTTGGVGSRVADSPGNQSVSTDVLRRSQPPRDSSSNGFLPSNELSGIAGRSVGGLAVSSDPSPNIGDRTELFGGHEFNRLVDVDERRSKPTLFSGLSDMAEIIQTSVVDQSEEQQQIENQVAYKPRSKAFSLSTLAPASSLKGLDSVFNKIEATTGLTIDEYVRDRLNESSTEELFNHYAAEQIDSLALSIYNHEVDNKATLIGHDTGIGKTRIICGLARYALAKGLIPTIVTADSVLYGDILARDAVDTGNEFNPLITNNDFKLILRSNDGRQTGEINTAKNQLERLRQYTQAGNIGQYDCVFTTYGQLTGPASVERRELLQALAAKTFLILDESHKAGGPAGDNQQNRKKNSQLPSCTEFFQSLVKETKGFVASSATAIKDPIVAARLFYETTDLKLAATDRDKFADHLKAGGVPLQQQVFSMWAESGGCIRCEKSYEGVEFGIAKYPVDLQTAENNSKLLNLIWRFDYIKEKVVAEISGDYADAGEAARKHNPALGDAGASSTIFTSVLHNLTAVTALGLKAEETANAAIADIEQGRKPILMLFNTMESTVRDFVDSHNELAALHNAEFPDSPMQPIRVGDDITINAGQLFTRYLEKARSIKITEPYLDELTGKQVTRTHRLTDTELGLEGVAAFNRAESAIASADWSKLPISPIDYIKQKIEDAGHSIGEITGRSHILKYGSAAELASGVVTYQTRERGTAQKKQVMDDFQNGRVDAVITNSTTGYSLHASRTVADQRQRVMYIVQPHLDVNQVEQSIGRSHRSGQVNPDIHPPDKLDAQGQPMWGQYPGTFGLPVFKLVVGQDLPTEERAVAILMKKMSHLKANTTGNSSSSFGLADMPDFINDYGNEVAGNLMEQNPELHEDLDFPLGGIDGFKDSKAIQKVTGRAVMLTSDAPPTPEQPYPSLARQAWLYETLTSDYKELLAQKIALGENELEAQKLDLQAEPVSRLVLSPGKPELDSPFTKPAYLVEVKAKTGAKPNTTLQVINVVRRELGFERVADKGDGALFDVREKGKAAATQLVEQLSGNATEYLASQKVVSEAGIVAAREKVDKFQQKLSAALEEQSTLQQHLKDAVSTSNVELSAKINGQLEQLAPKIDKLQTQTSKAKLDLNSKHFQQDKEQRAIKETLADTSELLQQIPIGQPIRWIDNKTKNYLFGIVAAVEQKSKANNPAAPINWKVKLLVVDGVRSLSIGLKNLSKGGNQSLELLETAVSFVNLKQEKSVYDLFDQRQSESKEKRYLVAGQVLATELTGKFAIVSDHLGQVHPVYLLRRGFNPAIDMNIKPIMFKGVEQIKQFFDKTQKIGLIKTEDENLTVIADIKPSNIGGIIIKTPKATAEGGIYFKNEGLLRLTGDFTSKTESVREGNNTKSKGIMTATVSADKTDEVLAYLESKWGLGAATHKDVAREILGQVLPSWEPCNEINPDAPRTPITRTAQSANGVAPQPPSKIMSEPSLEVFTEEPELAELISDRSLSDLNATTTTETRGTASKLPTPTVEGDRTTSSTLPAPENLAFAPEVIDSVQPENKILEPNNQHGAAEKNVAKLLHQAGIASEILKGEDFHLKAENQPFIPLSIERHGQNLYLTHYLKDNYGDLFMDAEMVFNVSDQGQLTLTQTATQNPLTGGEYRSCDRSFGQIFSRNLIQQRFGEAALLASLAKQQSATVQEQPSVEVGNQNQPASRQEQPLAKVDSSEQIEAPQQLEKVVAVTLKEQPKEPATTVAPVVNSSVQKADERSLQPLQVTAKEPAKPKSSLKPSTSTQATQAESLGVQLSLFDIGLSPSATAKSQPVVQSTAKVEKPTPINSQVGEPIQSVKETVTGLFVEAPPITKEVHSSKSSISPGSTTNKTEAVDPMQIFQQVVERVDKRTDEMLATLTSSIPSLNMLRDWYKAARELGKSPKHLDRISQTGHNFKQGEPLTDKAIEVVTKDFQAYYKQLIVVEQLSNLGDKDLLALNQNITNYLNSPPPSPPAQADRQKIELEVKQLAERINTLGHQQSEQLATVEAMQKSPFRSWNGKYDSAVAQVEQTANKLDNAIAHLQQRENQLGQWNKQEMAYSLWDKSPQTMEMRGLAKGLQSPQLQERLSSIAKVERQEFARSQVPSNRQAGLSA